MEGRFTNRFPNRGNNFLIGKVDLLIARQNGRRRRYTAMQDLDTVTVGGKYSATRSPRCMAAAQVELQPIVVGAMVCAALARKACPALLSSIRNL